MSKERSNSLAEAVANAAPSVVRINGRPRIPASGIVWSDKTIVTASHTIHTDEDVQVALEDGAGGTAKIVGRDTSTDVAVLRMKEPRAAMSVGGAPRVGNIVLALGRPGQSVRAAFGIISALGDRYIEVDGTLPAGFSGGPLIDADGRLIGMNTSRLVRGGTTIPVSTLERIIEEIVAQGSIRRPFLGVAVYPVENGLLVISVKRESGAERAGVLVGDVITGIGDRVLESPRSLRELLDGLAVGSDITLRITRGGEAKELRLTVGGD